MDTPVGIGDTGWAERLLVPNARPFGQARSHRRMASHGVPQVVYGGFLLPSTSRSADDRRRHRVSRAAAASPPRRPHAVPPRKYRHRNHGVFATNHRLRKAVTALAIGNIGKRRDAAAGGHGGDGHATRGCCDGHQKPRSHDTSQIAWAKLLARVGEEFPVQCPSFCSDVRLIAFITEPSPIPKILTHLAEPLEPPPILPARGPPTD